MTRSLVAVSLMLSIAVPAFSRSKGVEPVKGVYAMSCDALWAAVKNTLRNENNYDLTAVNDLTLHASFIVIGDLIVHTDRVALYQKNGGCAIKTDIKEVGPENTNWHLFHNRLGRTLARSLTTRAASASKTTGTPNSPPKTASP